jgi:NADH dehydrogenase FAD-containing subunit
MRPKRVVLVGAGHAHLHLLRRSDVFARRGIELILISPDGFWYSGLATGVLGGQYGTDLDFIDPEGLLQVCDGRYVRDRMTGLDRNRRSVLLENGDSELFDILSIDVGSAPPSIAGNADGILDVKPITNLILLRNAIEEQLRSAQLCEVAIVGSGVTAFELAANIAGLGKRRAGKVTVSIYGRGPLALTELPSGARNLVLNRLAQRGVIVHSMAEVVGAEDHVLLFADGSRRRFTFAINASGLMPEPIVGSLGLCVNDKGGLITDAYLKCADGIFAAGDCIAFRGTALPCVGVYAVRQAPVLLANILATLEGTALRAFRPQTHYLSIMNLGDGTGLAVRGRFWTHGRIAMLVKDIIDRRFVRH